MLKFNIFYVTLRLPLTCELIFSLYTVQQFVAFKIGDETIQLDVSSFIDGDALDVESLKVEIACVYFLQLSEEKRSKGTSFLQASQVTYDAIFTT